MCAFCENADDPTKIIQIVEHEAPESVEANRQSMASDLRVQTYLQMWRAMVPNVSADGCIGRSRGSSGE